MGSAQRGSKDREREDGGKGGRGGMEGSKDWERND